MAADLTLLMTLRGRPRFSARWLAYAESLRLPFRVLLADGGEERDAGKTASLVSNKGLFPHLEIEYLRYPFDAGIPEYQAKLVEALSRVRTPFVALVDNDDFPVPAGLERCLEFLRRNPDWIACGGKMAGLFLGPEPGLGAWNGYYGREVRFEDRKDFGDIAAATARSRVGAHFARYQATWYDVHRTQAHARIYETMLRQGLRDLLLAELLTSLLAAAKGKIKKLDALFLVRQYDAEGSSAAEVRRRGGPLDRMLPETWSHDFKNFTDALAQAVADTDGIPVEEAWTLVCEGYKAYITPGLLRSLDGKPSRSKRRALEGALRAVLGEGSLRTLKERRSRLKERLWAGEDGARALEAIRAFLSSPPQRPAEAS